MRASLHDAVVGDTRALCQFMFRVRFVPLVACPLSTCRWYFVPNANTLSHSFTIRDSWTTTLLFYPEGG